MLWPVDRHKRRLSVKLSDANCIQLSNRSAPARLIDEKGPKDPAQAILLERCGAQVGLQSASTDDVHRSLSVLPYLIGAQAIAAM